MGMNTTVFIRNDGLDQIQNHPDQFVDGIVHRLNGGGTVSVGNHANPVEVMPTQHADLFRLYATWKNSIVELAPGVADTKMFAELAPEAMASFIEMARWNLDRLEEELSE